MNNKGFAITGILYTLFIMFLLILASVLGGLSSRRNILQKSLLSLEESFSGIELSSEEISNANTSQIAPVDGKYEFKITLVTGEELNNCVSYLKKGAELDYNNITFVPKDCNDYEISNVLIEKIISFESE